MPNAFTIIVIGAAILIVALLLSSQSNAAMEACMSHNVSEDTCRYTLR